jgi:hypothetical protein
MLVMSTIFESPDGGKTVYRRLPGTSQRELYSDIVSDGRTLHEQLQENQMWYEIRRMARQDPALQDLLERAIMYYNLKREHDR